MQLLGDDIISWCIFSYLKYDDLKQVLLVSHQYNKWAHKTPVRDQSKSIHNFKECFKYWPNIKYIKASKTISTKFIKLLRKNLENLDIAGCCDLAGKNVFQSLTRLHSLTMRECRGIPAEAFKPLQHSLENLDISYTNITDDVFQYLENIRILKAHNCLKISGSGFKYLANIQLLDVSNCSLIMDNSFKYLPKIPDTLIVSGCNLITDEMLLYIVGVNSLDISFCTSIIGTTLGSISNKIHTLKINNMKISSDCLHYLSGIHTLDVSSQSISSLEYFKGCYSICLCASLFPISDLIYLHDIHTVNLTNTYITDDDISNLRGVNTLHISYCEYITDKALIYLSNIYELSINGCNITGSGFIYISGIYKLSAISCYLCDPYLSYLKGIKYLDISGCDDITGDTFCDLHGIDTLKIHNCKLVLPQNIENLRPHAKHIFFDILSLEHSSLSIKHYP